ncbi:MAG: penicillin acylase family protein [Longimonas sp.]|uniref:penicillin acylase family protein n=1 Tax=Longimonas sp. TaxID=2039626 RepID=UPI0033616268
MVYRLAVAALVGAFLTALGLLWWTQVAAPAAPPSSVSLPGQSTSATIGWEDDTPLLYVDASSERDAARALGMAHGMQHAWSMVLWRQAARGRLTHWLTSEALPLDRHARKMGWARTAQEHTGRLPSDDRAWLAAYAEGVNAAFATDYVQSQPPFALLSDPPAPWAPWHTLAVEHLLTWMATERPPLPDSATESMRTFASVDDDLRDWLGLHHWHDSMAWLLNVSAAGDSEGAGPALGYRLTRGHSIDPLVAPVWYTSPADTAWVATVPGTRWTLAHHTRTAHYLTLPRATAGWVRIPGDVAAPLAAERIRMQGGHEALVSTAFTDTTRVFTVSAEERARDTTLADSAWALTLPYRASLPEQANRFPDPAPLPQHASATLRHIAGGAPAVSGPTTPIRNAAGDSVGVVVSASPWRATWADRFQTYADRQAAVDAWAVDDTSTWARQRVVPLQEALAAHPPTDSLQAVAATFVQNWEGVFEPSSIGASLFRMWWDEIESLRAGPTRLDPALYFASVRYRRAFARAVERLKRTHGPDVRRWRWESVEPHRLWAPLWGDAHRLPERLYPSAGHRRPQASIPGRGHASTLTPGPDPEARRPAPGYHLHWIGRPGEPPHYSRTDPSRTLADRLLSPSDARSRAHRPAESPDVRIRLTP